jgi:hypothetical protein
LSLGSGHTTPVQSGPLSKMAFSDSLDSEDSFDDIDLACDVPNDLEEGYLAVIPFFYIDFIF